MQLKWAEYCSTLLVPGADSIPELTLCLQEGTDSAVIKESYLKKKEKKKSEL